MTTQPPIVVLKPKKSSAVKRRHPWVFSGAIQRIEGEVKEGDIVRITNTKGDYLATGYYQQGGSIAIRILSFTDVPIDPTFWEKRIRQAYTYRQKLNITEQTNAYRLINAAGDGLPGLIADYYNGTVVLQAHTWGMYQLQAEIVKALQTVLGDEMVAIYDKSAETLAKKVKQNLTNQYLYGKLEQQTITENGHQFLVNWEHGQKTGFFIDQRDNRLLISKLVKDKEVLNTFCYTGGFSIYALKAGAKVVDSVDSSQQAMDTLQENISLNQLNQEKHQAFKMDVMGFFADNPKQYDLIILDPPAYAKHMQARHNAIQAYKRQNIKALERIKKGGILATFSCSGVVNRELFNHTITAAAIETGRNIKIIRQLSAPPDHPTSIYHPEGQYLKGLLLYVD